MKKTILKITSIVMLIALVITFGRISDATRFESNDTKEIKNVVETFISHSYNYGISDYDTSLIDKDSKIFLKYFELRNKYREDTLALANYNKDNYKHVSKRFEFDKLDINKDIAVVKVKEIYNSIDSVEPGPENIDSGKMDFDVILRKINDQWKIHACKGYDDMSNAYDWKVKDINELVDWSVLDPQSKMSNDNVIDLEKLQKDVIEYENKEPVDLDSDVGVKENVYSYKSNNVNRGRMKNYMDKYYNSRNPKYKNFDPTDCANYGSQILVEGGARTGGGATMDGRFRLWDTKGGDKHSKGYGQAWTVAKYLRGYIVRNTANSGRGPVGYPIKWGSTLKTGDYCFLDLRKNGGISHTTIVYEGGPNFRVSAHSTDRHNARINSIHPEGAANGSYRSYIKIDNVY